MRIGHQTNDLKDVTYKMPSRYELPEDALSYARETSEELLALLDTLCRIPAPSNQEEARAEFLRNYLVDLGAEQTYIDPALNVVCPIGCEGKDDLHVLMAHTDTVFPMNTVLEPRIAGGRLCCPGVGDDTANVAVLLLALRYCLQKKLKPRHGLLFAFNSGEEGLGNLKGCRRLMRDYEGRVQSVLSFDGGLSHACNKAVGSSRYQISASTKGGHSFGSFGNRNAIEVLATLITDLYDVKVPQKSGTKTTYNVGVIQGGTSVNAIAQHASMLYEFRSDDRECLETMEQTLRRILTRRKSADAQVELQLLGQRPCMGDVDRAAQAALEEKYLGFMEAFTGKRPQTGSGSTDCNIPFSMGIPALCFGFYEGTGAHTLEESIDIKSLETGMQLCLAILLDLFEE